MSRVSNGMGQCNFLGQRDRSSFIVPGQRDNNRTSSKSCYRTGWAGTAYQISWLLLFGFLQDSAVKPEVLISSSVKTKIWIQSQVWNPNKCSCSDPKNEQPTNEKLNSRFTLIGPEVNSCPWKGLGLIYSPGPPPFQTFLQPCNLFMYAKPRAKL